MPGFRHADPSLLLAFAMVSNDEALTGIMARTGLEELVAGQGFKGFRVPLSISFSRYYNGGSSA